MESEELDIKVQEALLRAYERGRKYAEGSSKIKGNIPKETEPENFWVPTVAKEKGRTLARAISRPASDGQGFQKPHGYTGKGTAGKGQGTDFKTLEKPLPSSWVRGYPRVFHISELIGLLLRIF